MRANGGRLAALLTILAVLAALCGCGQADSDRLTVEILSIGKADCSILTDGTHTAVIDCGTADDGGAVLDALARLGAERIDLLIVSHYDKDHVGGAADVLRGIEVGELIEPDYEPENPGAAAYTAYREAAAGCGVSVTRVSGQAVRQLGRASLTIRGADGKVYEKNADNNASLLVEVEHEGNRLLFAGDVEKQRIADLLDEGVGPCDFLKVPHHGQYNARLPALFEALRPRYAAITCSEDAPPDADTLDALADAGCEVFLTTDGAVTLISSRAGLTVEPQTHSAWKKAG